MNKPKFLDDPAFKSLRSGDVASFVRESQGRTSVDCTDADFRATDFRPFDLKKVVLKGAYLKDADLRGCDLSHMDLEGCSIHNAKIGGTLFPHNLHASEILLSVQHGTRMRTSKS